MKQLKDITDKFKNTKFRVSMVGHAADDVQKAMFAMGFRIIYTPKGEVRKPLATTYAGKPVHAFYIDHNLRICYSCIPETFSKENGYREIAILEVFEASKEYKALDKALRKARKFEKKLAKLAIERGFTPNTGVRPQGNVVEVLFADGDTRSGAWDYTIPYSFNANSTVAGYKLEAESRVVSHEEMVATIVADAGGVEVDEDGFTKWDGTGFESSNEKLSGPVAMDTIIDVKYRDGEVQLNATAGSSKGGYSASHYYPAGAFWQADGYGNDIVAYRLSAPATTFEKAVVEPLKTFGDISDERCNDAPDTNPKRQYGVTSIPLNMWSSLASAYGALGLYNGSLKYGKANFANTPVEASIYIAAALRHLSAWAAGEEFDPADGVPNLGGVLANIAILLEARAAGMLIDDRLLMAGYLKERDALKEIVKALNELHAGKTPKHYSIAGV